MSESYIGLMSGQERSHWIRLRTLILLRWVAIGGQITAITVAQGLYNLQLNLGLCFFAVGVSVVGNLVAMFIFPENKRLSEFENFLTVLFDLLQLAFLLYLTGGLNNPFALLVLGPVTISANMMRLRSTLIIGGTAIILVTLMTEFHVPLRTAQGFILRIPEVLSSETGLPSSSQFCFWGHTHTGSAQKCDQCRMRWRRRSLRYLENRN